MKKSNCCINCLLFDTFGGKCINSSCKCHSTPAPVKEDKNLTEPIVSDTITTVNPAKYPPKISHI
jgi:hypothetical protein